LEIECGTTRMNVGSARLATFLEELRGLLSGSAVRNPSYHE